MEALNQVGVQNDLAVSSAAVTLTIPTDTSPGHMLLHVGDGAIRWTADGTTPTTAIGMPVVAGSYVDWTDPETDYRGMIQQFSAIIDGATDAVLNVAFFD